MLLKIKSLYNIEESVCMKLYICKCHVWPVGVYYYHYYNNYYNFQNGQHLVLENNLCGLPSITPTENVLNM